MKKYIIALAAILLLSSNLHAQVLGTNTPITEGTCASGVAGADVLCANSADHTLSVNANNGTLFNLPQTVYLTGSDYTNATTGFTSVSGLAFPVSASRNYKASCTIYWSGSAGTTGPKYQFTGPATPTAVVLGVHSNVTSSTYLELSAAAFSSAVANTGTVTTGTVFIDRVDLAVLNSTNAGTVQLQMAANGVGTLTVKIGSNCIFQ